MKTRPDVPAIALLATTVLAAVGIAIYRLLTRPRTTVRFRYMNEVDADPDDVFQTFADPESLTRPMAHASTERTDDGDVRWVQSGPFGLRQSWRPTVDVDPESHRVVWASDADSPVDVRGTVEVQPTEDGRALVSFYTEFEVPMPIWPDAVQEATKDRIVDDLDRVCHDLEVN